ncbi:dTDP-4-dehydrorhamnose 3,5-epimerase [Allopusillimonas ginsengisoli]|uniref:dTDP-4-dehydrorhamnose 3,5-epimerase n=1 Tax=Allopusillimonas ginsengisoli TaxID=453575 RepID=UPI0010224956|nr:dTDP-4-dehydrorhamnose 3,5-epimerase [Allopusillimonas ginsengisoli]TEA77881.1 dTDP-4-dehydrorhamnose 3,5-epimerase [Allopusillimonas ginsengisoli]
MKIQGTPLPGLMLIEVPVFHDERGFFLETFQASRYAALLGTDLQFVQDNCSRSRQGVLRGMHYQREYPQGKLLRVIHGKVFDVAVDLRRDSPTFGHWHGTTLSACQHNATETQLWVPAGFAHGFLVLSEDAVVEYKCTAYYHPGDEVCLRWDDADVGILWPECPAGPILSGKDTQGMTLAVLKQSGLLP